MSHTTVIDEIVFSDTEALKAAVRDLQKRGINCELKQNVKPRSYSANQAGMGVAPFVLNLKDGQYDVGFYMDKAKGGHVAKTDFWGDHVANVLGAKRQGKETASQGALGQLIQAYGIQAATRQGLRQGYQVQQIKKKDGSVQLRMTGM